jgi:hypothetical protein
MLTYDEYFNNVTMGHTYSVVNVPHAIRAIPNWKFAVTLFKKRVAGKSKMMYPT